MRLFLFLSCAFLTVHCGQTKVKTSEPAAFSSPENQSNDPSNSNHTSQNLGAIALPQRVELKAQFSSINQNIIQAKCAGCHSEPSPSAGIRLENYEQIVSYVDFQNPGEGLLMQRASAVDSSIMPPAPFLPLSTSELEIIQEWVSRGAPND